MSRDSRERESMAVLGCCRRRCHAIAHKRVDQAVLGKNGGKRGVDGTEEPRAAMWHRKALGGHAERRGVDAQRDVPVAARGGCDRLGVRSLAGSAVSGAVSQHIEPGAADDRGREHRRTKCT